MDLVIGRLLLVWAKGVIGSQCGWGVNNAAKILMGEGWCNAMQLGF